MPGAVSVLSAQCLGLISRSVWDGSGLQNHEAGFDSLAGCDGPSAQAGQNRLRSENWLLLCRYWDWLYN
jgi:hypothetical protein